jgi:hypothetical protein
MTVDYDTAGSSYPIFGFVGHVQDDLVTTAILTIAE